MPTVKVQLEDGTWKSVTQPIGYTSDLYWTIMEKTNIPNAFGGEDNFIDQSAEASFVAGGIDAYIEHNSSAHQAAASKDWYGEYYYEDGAWTRSDEDVKGFNFVGVGDYLYVSGDFSAILGGDDNAVYDQFSTIINGKRNYIYEKGSFIGGGRNNDNYSRYAFIGTGTNNAISNSRYGFIGSGERNYVGNSGGDEDEASYNSVVTGYRNLVAGHSFIVDRYWTYSHINHSFIGSGGENEVRSSYSGIVTGLKNQINSDNTNDYMYAAIAGGRENTLNNEYGFISGGWNNTIDGGSHSSIIGGGKDNELLNASFSTVLGGSGNQVEGFEKAYLLGDDGIGTSDGTFIFSNGRFGEGIEAAQHEKTLLMAQTTGDAASDLTVKGYTQGVRFYGQSETISIKGKVMGHRGTGSKVWDVDLIVSNAGETEPTFIKNAILEEGVTGDATDMTLTVALGDHPDFTVNGITGDVFWLGDLEVTRLAPPV